MVILLFIVTLIPGAAFGTPCCDASIIATERLTVQSGATLLGDVIAGTAFIHPDATVDGNLEFNGRDVSWNHRRFKMPFYRSGKRICFGRFHETPVSGEEDIYIPVIPAEAFPVINRMVVIKNGMNEYLAPGAFGDTSVHSRSSIWLRSGTYNFKSLNIGPDVTINFDTGNGPVRINVAGKVLLGSRIHYHINGSGMIVLYGLDDISLFPNQEFPGSLITPFGEVSIMPGVIVEGNVGARSITISSGCRAGSTDTGLFGTMEAVPGNTGPFDLFVVAEDIEPFGSANEGIDDLAGTAGDDYFDGGDGADTIDGFDGNDVIRGGEGNDTLFGGYGSDRMTGGAGEDYIDGGNGDDVVSGGDGDDTLIVSSGRNIINGGNGNDNISGGIDADWICGGGGDDLASGGQGDDTYVYAPGDGNDRFDGGPGADIIGLDRVLTIKGWKITPDGGSRQPLYSYLMFRSTSDTISGVITTPKGETLRFFDVEDILVNYPVMESGRSIPVALPRMNRHLDIQTVVISGLPQSVIVKEGSMPQLDKNGEYFQLLDAKTLLDNTICLDVRPGFFGKLNLKVTAFYKTHRKLHKWSTPLHLYITPTNDTLLFAQSGDFGIDVVNGEAVQGRIPLDIVVNPLLKRNVRITLSGLPSGVSLIRPDGSEILYTDGCAVLAKEDLTGLSLDINGQYESFQINVTLEGSSDCRGVRAVRTIFVPVSNDMYVANNGDTVIRFDGRRSDFTVKRIGNVLEISSIDDPGMITRVNMIVVDHLRFDDGFVSSRDYTTDIDLSSFLNQPLDPNTLILVSDLPAGVIPNNSIPVDKGVYAIPVRDIQNNIISLDHSTTCFSVSGGMHISAYVATDAQMEALNGAARISGYANARLYADAGFDAALTVGPDGVRMGARAYIEAGAVATAGGSVTLGNAVTATGTVTAEAYVSAELEAHFQATDEDFTVEAYAGVQANVSLSADGEVRLAAIPGTSAGAGGAVGASAYAYVDGQGGVHYGDGDYGAEGDMNLGAGVSANAAYYAEGQVAGIGMNGGGGVSAGAAVEFGVGGEFGFSDGTLTVGISGEIQLILGVEIDLSFQIDFNEIADTAELIGEGVIDVAEAIGEGFITVAEAIGEGFITGVEAVAQGFITVAEAIGEGFITGVEAVANGLIDVTSAIANGFITGVEAVANGFMDVTTALTNGFITGVEAVANGFMDVTTALVDGFISGADAVREGFISIGEAALGGFIDASTAIAEGFVDSVEAFEAAGRAVWEAGSDFVDGLGDFGIDVAENIGDFFSDIGDATIICTELYRQGLMEEWVFRADTEFGALLHKTRPDVMTGYYVLARPIVSLMKKSGTFTHIVNFFAKPWSHEMAYRLGAAPKGNLGGAIIMSAGMPLCDIVGKITNGKINVLLLSFTMICLLMFLYYFKMIQKNNKRYIALELTAQGIQKSFVDKINEKLVINKACNGKTGCMHPAG